MFIVKFLQKWILKKTNSIVDIIDNIDDIIDNIELWQLQKAKKPKPKLKPSQSLDCHGNRRHTTTHHHHINFLLGCFSDPCGQFWVCGMGGQLTSF